MHWLGEVVNVVHIDATMIRLITSIHPPYHQLLLLTPLKLYLRVQRLLPPITPLVCCRIPQLANTSNIQVLHRRVLAVQVKVRHTLRVRVATLREVGDILLQRNSDSRVGHAAECTRARHIGVVESVRDVEAVKSGRSREQVSIGLVVVRFVKVECVAGEA